jgi:uncharacterized protein (DUF58 family)
MLKNTLPLMVVLFLIAIITRDDFSFALFYLFLGVYALGTWWFNRAISGVSFRREHESHVFLGERIEVQLTLVNKSWLPVPWLRVHEGLPIALRGAGSFQRVTSLGPRASKAYTYTLAGRKRGYYPVGPLYLSSGDFFGLFSAELQREGAPEYVTVYPQIVPLTSMALPSHSPMGTLRHTQPVFEDPTRVMGIRDYSHGDSLRWVDWKKTASTGRLQVKVFEPSISLAVMIFLNLNLDDYHFRTRFQASELAIVIAASIANWVFREGQAFGLCINGADPVREEQAPLCLPPRKGHQHLTHVLENLARAQVAERPPFPALLRDQFVHLTWGTTIIAITNRAADDLVDVLYRARRAGLNAELILSGVVPDARAVVQRGEHFGISVVPITRQSDLDIWRG